MSDDIYKSPTSQLIQDVDREQVLASRWNRLAASLVDTLVLGFITIPLLYFTGGLSDIIQGIQPSLGYSVLMSVIGIMAFFLINGKFLLKNGQTLGKKALDIKIVDLEGRLPSVQKHLLARYAVYFIPGQIPFVGQFLSIINILFIFGNEKRCIHDYVAGTKVVVA